jgi:hypothetical protein
MRLLSARALCPAQALEQSQPFAACVLAIAAVYEAAHDLITGFCLGTRQQRAQEDVAKRHNSDEPGDKYMVKRIATGSLSMPQRGPMHLSAGLKRPELFCIPLPPFCTHVIVHGTR